MTNGNDSIHPLINGLEGLTKRELISAMCMQGLLANNGHENPTPETVAKNAVNYADKLIEALNK
jgi:hypothetical protein